MIDYDDLPASIDRLHAEAEDLADLARRTPDPEQKRLLQQQALAKVRVAAQLREQAGE